MKNPASWHIYRTRIRTVLSMRIEAPIAKIFHQLGFSPNALTVLGLSISLFAAYLIYAGYFMLGGVVVLVGGFMDLIDGSLARLQNNANETGALLDSIFDRISELCILFGLLLFYVERGAVMETVLIFLALGGSFMVSYIRARGEGLGVDCRVGFMTRPERVLLIAGGLLIDQMLVVLLAIVLLTCVTSIQRFWYVYQTLKKW
mgnify:CR=1 FL=1